MKGSDMAALFALIVVAPRLSEKTAWFAWAAFAVAYFVMKAMESGV